MPDRAEVVEKMAERLHNYYFAHEPGQLVPCRACRRIAAELLAIAETMKEEEAAGWCVEHERPAADCQRLATADFGLPAFTNCEWTDGGPVG